MNSGSRLRQSYVVFAVLPILVFAGCAPDIDRGRPIVSTSAASTSADSSAVATSSASGGVGTASAAGGLGGAGGAGGSGKGGNGNGGANPGCGPIVAGDPSPCLGLGPGNITLCLDGDEDEFIHPGMEKIVATSWSHYGFPERLNVELDPGFWNLGFATVNMSKPLEVAVYENARCGETAAQPELCVGGNAHGCEATGEFEITDIEIVGDDITRFTATFRQTCKGSKAALRGCIHYED